MNKQPLTPAGFQALQTELYALSESELHEQSILIKYDFKNWIVAHFILEPSQVDFLNALPTSCITFLADSTSVAVANKLPIYLEKQDNPITPMGNKFIRPKDELEGTASSDGSFTVDGQLTIEIGYQ